MERSENKNRYCTERQAHSQILAAKEISCSKSEAPLDRVNRCREMASCSAEENNWESWLEQNLRNSDRKTILVN